jgi:glutamate 5-kinase
MNKTIVIKIGSSTLTNGSSHLHKPGILELVRQVAALQAMGHRVLLVSSGAVAAGRDHLGHPKLSAALPIKQMLSAVGQGQLMQLYSELFSFYGVKVGQVLVTAEDLQRNRVRYLNTRDTLNTLLQYSILPIINENDTVAVDEIKVGDNDNLSALIAALVNADWLILLTDREGLYDKDPRQYPDAQRIEHVPQITEAIRALAGGTSSSGLGTGGMMTKIQAAELAGRNGIETIIAQGRGENILLRLVAGEKLGTRISPSAPRVESRKRWFLSEPHLGRLIVDAGAAKALRRGQVSLLPVGLLRVEGEFERGAMVQIEDEGGKILARGEASYNHEELGRLCGVKSAQIESLLGYTYGNEAVHHDNMAFIKHEDQ